MQGQPLLAGRATSFEERMNGAHHTGCPGALCGCSSLVPETRFVERQQKRWWLRASLSLVVAGTGPGMLAALAPTVVETEPQRPAAWEAAGVAEAAGTPAEVGNSPPVRRHTRPILNLCQHMIILFDCSGLLVAHRWRRCRGCRAGFRSSAAGRWACTLSSILDRSPRQSCSRNLQHDQ